jgi:hypothetical protein
MRPRSEWESNVEFAPLAPVMPPPLIFGDRLAETHLSVSRKALRLIYSMNGLRAGGEPQCPQRESVCVSSHVGKTDCSISSINDGNTFHCIRR